MPKILQKHLETSYIRISAIYAMLYMMLFNSAVVAHKFSYYKAGGVRAILELSKDFVYIYIALFIFFFGLTINHTLFYFAVTLLFVTGALASYYLYFFQIIPTKEVVGALFTTHFEELFEIISTRLLIWLIFSVFIAVYTIKHFGINNTKLFFTKLLSAACLFVIINAIISPPYKVLNGYFPIQYLHSAYSYFMGTFGYSAVKTDISKEFAFKDNSKQDVVGVLVIGESARYDHFGINGYERDTTPLLQSVNNLFSFEARPCSNITWVSVPCLLSACGSRDVDKAFMQTGLVSVLSNIGFDTTWIGTQSLMKYFRNKNLGEIYDEANFAVMPGGSALFASNSYDHVMLPYIKDMLNESSGKRFIVVHTCGSHWNYASRYPVEFAHFKPGCNVIGKADPSSCGNEGLVNIYDNSILYTDLFLFNLIEVLKEKNALLFYVSDHGESLGENGRYGHGGEIAPEQMQVPLMVWASDLFIKNNPRFVSAMTSHLKHKISHDNVFHSILHCLDIHSEIIDENLSLCNNKT